MIIITKQHVQRYLGLHKNLDTAIHFMLETDLTSLPLGKTIIDGDDVFVNHFQYETEPKELGFLEGHEYYLDIHMVLSGRECIGYCDTSLVTMTQPYDEKNDFYKYQGEVKNFVLLDSDVFAITFQEDAHQPKVMADQPEQVDKLVFKVKVK